MSQHADRAWVRVVRPSPRVGLRLFCFPHAGGGPSMFHHWAARLPPTVEVCAIRLPGRESRYLEPPYTDMAPLLRDLAAATDPLLDRPFAVFGHSLGALVGFEFARSAFVRRQLLPVLFMPAARSGPHAPKAREPVSTRPTADFIEVLRAYNGMPAEILANDKLLELTLPVLRADFALGDGYSYRREPRLRCPVTVFGGRQDKTCTEAQLAGWQEVTSHPVNIRMLPGDHFFLRSHASVLLAAINEDLGPYLEPRSPAAGGPGR